MKKQVYIIGAGLGRATLTAEAKKILKDTQVIIGEENTIACYTDLKCDFFPTGRPEEIESIVRNAKKERFAILVPGDVGFFSPAFALGDKLSDLDVRYLPGLSCISYMSAKCCIPWEDAAYVFNGREQGCTIIDAVRRNKFTFAMNFGNVREIADLLCGVGFDELTVQVGERLGAKNEIVYPVKLSELGKLNCPTGTVLCIENPDFNARTSAGISDSEFERTDAPMLKSASRAVALSKLCIPSNAVCADIGCGCGAASVEMALAAYEGRVYAIDKSEAFIESARENVKKFRLGNVELICGSAPNVLESLPALDIALINGYNGRTDELVDMLVDMNPAVRIAISAVSPQGCTRAITALEDAGLEVGLTQISASNGYKSNGLHIMSTENPIYIVFGQRV